MGVGNLTAFGEECVGFSTEPVLEGLPGKFQKYEASFLRSLIGILTVGVAELFYAGIKPLVLSLEAPIKSLFGRCTKGPVSRSA